MKLGKSGSCLKNWRLLLKKGNGRERIEKDEVAVEIETIRFPEFHDRFSQFSKGRIVLRPFIEG